MQGPVGEIITAISPYSEADPAALTLQLLVASGNVIGRGPHFYVEQTRHATNLFAVVVGQTARARKGTSWDHVAALLRAVDPAWLESNVISGLGSGEGLIEAAALRSDSEPPGQGVRIFCLEDEFGSDLKVMGKPGSLLSNILRQGYDGRPLQNTTRTAPLLVKNPHVSLVGHLTQHDLERYLAHVEIFNGFGNRVLWTCAKRSGYLPYGGQLAATELNRIRDRLRRAVDFACRVGEVGLSPASRELWGEQYRRLTTSDPASGPMVDAVTCRAEAQVRRLATLFAVLDEHHEVRRQHLLAALEIWRYCADSARFIFGRAGQGSIEARILDVLPTGWPGITRTAISDLLSHHRSSAEIEATLRSLQRRGLARARAVSTGGRSAEQWAVTGKD
jgi:hypothetical protein